MENSEVKTLIESYFDVGWEDHENDPRVKNIVDEMKAMSELYLKAKTSKSGDNMIATMAMEAELKRMKEELLEVLDTIRIENPEQEEIGGQVEQEAVVEDELTQSNFAQGALVKPKKDKLTTIALGLSVVALLASAGNFFMASSSNVSKLEFEEYKSGAKSHIMKDVSDANQSVRDELATFKQDAEAIRTEIASLRQEYSAAKEELNGKLAAQASELETKIAALQASQRRAPPKKAQHHS